jgi:hypothetical protein
VAGQDERIVWDDAALNAIDDDPRVQMLLDRMASEAVLTMKRFANVSPVGPLHRSGTMRSSIHVFRDSDRSKRDVGPTADYARYVNDGTRPHEIRSTGPWPLRNRETGQVFGRVVHHPGYIGSHFVERTAQTFEGRTVHI